MPKTINNFMPADLEFQMFVLDEHADKLLAEGKDILKLTIGVPELPTPPAVLDRIVEAVGDPNFVRRVFPEGLPELREAIATHYNAKYRSEISKDNIIVSTGTSPIFRNIFQLVSGQGREILLPRPYYALYVYCARLANAAVKFYDIDPVSMRVDMDSFRENFSPEKTALVVVNSPGNPLGNIVNPDELRQIYEITDGQAYILNDEIYNNCLFYEDFQSALDVLREYQDTTIVTNSFSKGFRMYTKRVGFAILPPELQTNLRVMQQHTLLCTLFYYLVSYWIT
ncbi:MAG TPA: pyridoxal phosphate-dependent aminotransferase [Dehalococcoidia bacterium]|nr:pyridoxal phosphate-dependent aminotransferase [Dehalococcoidia bacterium]